MGGMPGGLRALYKRHGENMIQNPPSRIDHSAPIGRLPPPVMVALVYPQSGHSDQIGRLRRVNRTVSEMGPIDGRMFQDYLSIVIPIPSLDGAMDNFRTPSGYSVASTTGFDDMGDQLDLTDRLRQELQSTATPARLRDLGGFLTILLNLERERDPKATTLEVLRYTRLDKLVEETIHWRVDDRTAFNTQECALVFRTFVLKVAKELQLEWQVKFGEKYFTIDKARLDSLAVDGALRGVSLNLGYRANFEDRWNTMPRNLAAKQFGNLGFAPGDWWLNVQCATRDGIIASPVDIMTTSINRNVVYALVLETGLEVIGNGVNLYTKRGRYNEMLLPLLSQRDRAFRLLRKYGLNSAWAPSAGLRYDGLYLVVSYSWRCIDAERNEYQVQIGLKRVEAQKPMPLVVNTSPKPSQLDDWVLYNEILTDDYRSRTESIAVYAARKRYEEEELEESARLEAKRAVRKHYEANKM